MLASARKIPQRRSLFWSALLAIGMVILSYVFTATLAVACAALSLWLLVMYPNLQTVLLFLGGIAAAGIMLWSLVPRRNKFVAPGVLLEPDVHPRMFRELGAIASSLQEPMPREVYLIGEPNAWVADRGGFMGIGSRRVMGIGLPLLGALSLAQLRAILAHEFAHYYGGDTRLGPWVYKAQSSMVRTFKGLGSIEGTSLPAALVFVFAIATLVLSWYWRLFLRAINAVSRRQEYRADELACIVGGKQAFLDGLTTTHKAVYAWPTYWRDDVNRMLNGGCLPSISAGFSRFLASPQVAFQVQTVLGLEIKNAKVTPYDSHPPLRDRIAAVEGLEVEPGSEDPEPALVLLNDPEGQELRLLLHLNSALTPNALRRVSWEEYGSKVLIPSWQSWVTQYASLLKDVTPGNLRQALDRVPQVASYIRDPQGMLLRPQQREERARFLLSAAFAIALLGHGWTLHASPGELYLSRGDERCDPFATVRRLQDGSLPSLKWIAQCQELGITELRFVSSAEMGSGA
jgi:heat shock protein HtpX